MFASYKRKIRIELAELVMQLEAFSEQDFLLVLGVFFVAERIGHLEFDLK